MTRFLCTLLFSLSCFAAHPCIAIIDSHNVVTKQMVAAIQTQLDRDVLPAWGLTAILDLHHERRYDYAVLLTDAPNGRHYVDASGRPTAEVAWWSTDLSVVLSHEILEMVVNPYLDRTAYFAYPNGLGFVFNWEICDPVQGSTYSIDGVRVSDFVYPSYFRQTYGRTPFDHLGLLHAAGSLVTGSGAINGFQVTQ